MGWNSSRVHLFTSSLTTNLCVAFILRYLALYKSNIDKLCNRCAALLFLCGKNSDNKRGKACEKLQEGNAIITNGQLHFPTCELSRRVGMMELVNAPQPQPAHRVGRADLKL